MSRQTTGSQTVEAPTGQLEDLVLLVPRDPDWAVAIWQVNAESVSAVRERMTTPRAQGKMQLRVYPITGGIGRRRPVQIYQIANWIGQRLVLLHRPGEPHQAAVGFVDAAGTFSPVARSDVLSAPGSGQSARSARLGQKPPTTSSESGEART